MCGFGSCAGGCTDKKALLDTAEKLNGAICNLYGFFSLVQGYLYYKIGENAAVDIETLADSYTEPLRQISQKLEELAK